MLDIIDKLFERPDLEELISRYDHRTDRVATAQMFTKNLELLGQPSGGGFQSGNGRFNDAGYRVRARPPVQNICAPSSDIAWAFWMYRCRARSG